MNERNDALVPMPDTHHPYYDESDATTIRSAIANGLHAVRFVDKRSMESAFYAEPMEPITAALPVLTLTIKKCMGGAPFVGDPYLNDARYVWHVAVDDLGRHVAAEAVLTWRHEPPAFMEPVEPAATTSWRDVAAVGPEFVQAYVQEHGPLPDGPITEVAWNKFYAWMQGLA